MRSRYRRTGSDSKILWHFRKGFAKPAFRYRKGPEAGLRLLNTKDSQILHTGHFRQPGAQADFFVLTFVLCSIIILLDEHRIYMRGCESDGNSD